MRFLPYLLPLAVCLNAWAIDGRVTAAGRPVPGAIVSLRGVASPEITSTDDEGRFRLPDAPAGAALEVRLPGFTTLRHPLRAEDVGKPLELTLAIEPVRTGPAQMAQQQEGAQLLLEASPVRVEAPAESAESAESFLVQGSLSRGLQEEGPPMGMEFGGPFGGPPGGGPPGMMPGQGGADQPAGATAGFGVAGARAEMATARGGPPGGFGGGPGGGGPGGGGPPGGFGGGPGMEGGRRGMDVSRMAPKEREKMRKAFEARRRAGGSEGFGNRSRRDRDQIRGGASFNVRNSLFDAAPFAVNGKTSEKPEYSQYRYNFTLGGSLPSKWFGKGAGMFFINYSGARGRNPFNRFAVMPTETLREGNFAGAGATIYDPLSGSPFPQNRIPVSRQSAASRGLLELMPLPNQTGVRQNYSFTSSNPNDSDNFSVRLNRSLSAKDRFNFSAGWQTRSSLTYQLYGWADSSDNGGSNYDIGWTRNFTPRLFHNLRARYNRNRSEAIPYFANGRDISGALGITGNSRDPANFGPPNLNFTNYGDLTDGNRALRRTHTWGLNDGWTFVLREHTLHAGFDFNYTQLNNVAEQNARGTLFFGGLTTSAFDAQGLPVSRTGLDFADFLLGYAQQSQIRFGSPDSYLRGKQYSIFLQDEWRVRPGLTLNIGLRWEDREPYTEKYNRLANLDISPGFDAVALVLPGQRGKYSGVSSNGLVLPDRNNLSPRLGVAFRPSQKKRLILRGGFSVLYDSGALSRIPSRLISQPPFGESATFNASTANPLPITGPFAGSRDVLFRNTYAVSPFYHLPFAQTWNAAVQNEWHNTVFEIGYLGTRGSGLVIQRLPNRAAPGSPLTSEERRPIADAVGFTYDSPEGDSVFHAAQFRLTRRMRRGLSWGALYTFSKSIDNASSIGGTGNVVVQNDKNLAAERGLSSFDRRHQLNFNGMFMSPFGPQGIFMRRRTLWSKMLSEWSLTTGITLTSGGPLTARVLGQVADAGGSGATGSARADATGLPIKIDGSYFNTAAFREPAANAYGNAGRNTIPGPNSFVLNGSFGRGFQLGGEPRHRMDLRLEAQNVINHVNITGLGTVVNSANYGLATQGGDMRSMQVSARFRF